MREMEEPMTFHPNVETAPRIDPGAPLGLLTNAVQTLAGILLPSATVFLLLLCNDKAVLGPWTNSRELNLFTGSVIVVLVLLSIILTVSVLFPEALNETVILAILFGGGSLGILIALGALLAKRPGRNASSSDGGALSRSRHRAAVLAMPPARHFLPSAVGGGQDLDVCLACLSRPRDRAFLIGSPRLQ
jgi:hypothetical protein